ncbi:hypothetical protein CUJ83_10710 [Methanocella sp. CWC-04]|uniref:Uncharacterized protein n=1 Tax=Methanooceanicella nereidis TaxID=2052831 RepID=A0AAP2W5G3_9EURY|nr:hypothetical protein [Methanocella sp. CWC-04]MCD1295470.1 hypothetical protein [Methanocella sp. CWC-04]
MRINIDEYDVEHFCWICKKIVLQPRAVISMTMDKTLNGEVHLHKIMEMECHGNKMIQESKTNLVVRSFDIDDTTKSYEASGKLVMDYIDKGYEITYLKLG